MEFSKLDLSVDVGPLRQALETTDLWDAIPFRKVGPHVEASDIWVRYNDIQPFLSSGNLATLNDEHDSVWFRSAIVPLIKPIAHKIMSHVDGERLGGILLTRLPPYGKVYRHVDHGWHAEYYEKYYVCVKDNGSQFQFIHDSIKPKEGEVYWFNNANPHGVQNGAQERMALIVCIKIDKGE